MVGVRWLIPVLFINLTVSAQSVFPVRDEGEPRNRSYDVLHYRVEVSFDEAKKMVIGSVTTTLVPFLSSLSVIDFDAEEMQIGRVRFRGKDLKFEVKPKNLLISLDRPYSFRDTLTVTVDYTCTPRRGLYFVQPDSAYPDTPWQIWTQGEDMDSHFWFPCYDFPNDKATSEVLVTVARKYVALSNGTLLGVREDTRRGTKMFHWKQSLPHSSYLVMLAIGEYTVLRGKAGKLPLEYYVYPGTVTDAKVCFEKTPDMVRFFGEKIGFAYPWEKYAQVLIRDFVAGGMENTSATSLLDDITILDSRARLDNSAVSLIAHELAHQWWGDVVTCKDWRHLWLNESFASYFDPLYHEYLLGRDEFDFQMYNAQLRGIEVDRRLGRKPIVSVGSYGENVYPRGAAVLHMLRFVLGDELFWRALRHYITKHQFQPVETRDLEVAIEEATGQNLHWFFDQWVYRAGYPVFDVSYRWDDSTRSVFLKVTQTQPMDSLTGVFRTPVDVEITTPSGSISHRVNIMTAETTLVLGPTARPELVIFDRGNWLLKEVHYERSAGEWIYAAAHALNPVDRLRGVKQLAWMQDTASVLEQLRQTAASDRFWAVREEAVRALGNNHNDDPGIRSQIFAALRSAARDSRSSVRAAAIAQLSRFPGGESAGILHTALGDSSYTVVAAALRSIAKADSANALPVLTAHLDIPSQRQVIANAALESLPAVDSARAMTIAAERVGYGQPLTTRYAALRIVSRYARNNPVMLSTLTSLGSDRNASIRSTALHALGEAGNESVLPLLDSIASDPSDRASRVAQESARKIRDRQETH